MRHARARKRLNEYNDLFKENDEIYRAAAKRLGLPDCAFWILYTLRESSAPLTQSEICSALYQPKQTVNSALKHLEAEGYLRLSSGSDRRSKQVRLTERGLALAENTIDRVLAAECSAMLDMSEEEQAAFISLLRKYTESLKARMDAL